MCVWTACLVDDYVGCVYCCIGADGYYVLVGVMPVACCYGCVGYGGTYGPGGATFRRLLRTAML